MRTVITLSPPLDTPALCQNLQETMAAGVQDPVLVDVSALNADVTTLEVLSRLQLTARRAGHQIAVRHPSHPLRALLTATGLRDLVPEDPF